MVDTEIGTCYCTDERCKHENELRCGKPLSAKATAELRLEKEQFADYKLGICDACWENVQKNRKVA
jgi:hypothetical protein